MVTLHPAVVYYRSEDGQMSHKSRVLVSDELGNKSATVFAFKKHASTFIFITTLTAPPLNTEIKTIFYLLSHHKELFGVNASWNYFKAGHGKGPCNGVGGSVKWMADEAVRQQKVTTRMPLTSLLGHSSTSLQALLLSPLFPRRPVVQLNQKLRNLES